MCGIAGALAFSDRASGGRVAAAMAERLRHRGPDRRAVHVSPGGRCTLGHARLRIIDLETGDQPMANEDGTVHVVFNGEIYNFAELRRTLEAAGHVFRTQSDTEAIVHGYERWGDAVVERLDGMFAFAVWDERRGRLLLARDRPGEKPLFVYRDADVLVFASELKAVLAHPGVDASLDPAAVPLYLAYGYVPTPGTFHRRIQKLPPASCLAVEADGTSREWRYWDLDFRPQRVALGDAAATVRTALGDAVARRLVADVPLGAFCSGGLDSAIVVGLMAERSARPVRTFSIGCADDPTYDETAYARLVARHFGTDHTELVVEPDAIALLDRLVAAYDEPFGDSSAIPTHLVSALTRERVAVALTGDGGDELFAGYLRFYGAVVAERLPRWAIALGDAAGRRLGGAGHFRSPARRLARFFRAAALPLDERMLRWIGFFADQLDALLQPELAAAVERPGLTRSFRAPIERMRHGSPLARVLYLNFHTYLLDDLLPKADRCSMAHGLELRAPFLDTRVMQLAASLPDRLKLHHGRTKHVLRHAFRDMLPPAILRRGKMGFGIPIGRWFRSRWRPVLEERLLPGDARLWRWLRPAAVRRLVDEHLAGRADHGHQLWALLTLETFLQQEGRA